MRTLNELEARLTLIYGNSFVNVKRLNWINLEIEGKENSYLIILDHEGSGLIKIDGEPYFELDKYHVIIPLPVGKHKISVEMSEYKDFGEKVHPSPGIPYYAELDFNAYRLYIYGTQVLDLIKSVEDEELRNDLIYALTKALKEAYFETISNDQLFIISKLAKTSLDLSRIYKELEYRMEEDKNREKYKKGLEVLKEELLKLKEKYGKRGVLIGIGHAHIDTAWLWPFDETKRKVIRTFSTVLTLLDKYNFRFIQSSALYYEWVKEIYPELFEKIKVKVKENKWELGAFYVESDTNMISGESLARQLLYSQRFYLENFDKIAKILWLPDTFGFSASLPQIAKLGGIELFATHKVFWNDTNKFPYNVFKWVTPNNDYLPSIAFGNGKGGYNSDFSVSSVLEQYKNWREKDQPVLYSFGYGDGGGGPNEEMLIRAEAIDLLPILPSVKFEEIKVNPIDEWKGELYLETHRGVFTSHSKMKLLNRKAEVSLREAELWSSLAGNYDKERFRRLWKIVLKNQFHDVLPGSAIKDVYKVAYEELEKVIEEAENIAKEAMLKLLGSQGEEIYLFNSLNWDREEYVEINGKFYKVKVPSIGFTAFKPEEVKEKVNVKEFEDYYQIENKFFVLKLGKEGKLLSLYDKEAKREVLKGPSNVLTFYENIPGWADAWDIEKGYEETNFVVKASSSTVIEDTVVNVKYTYKFRNSEVYQIVRIYPDHRRIDFITTLRMRDRELLLKAWFNFDVNTDKAISDIPFGVIERFTWQNTSWDMARFEVPIQKFVDLSEGNYGVALLSEGKYGVSLRGTSVGLSLTKTPLYPDPTTDLEEVTFTYSLYPHIGDWRKAEVIKRAYELNIPIKIVRGKSAEKEKSFVKINNLILEAVKIAEDDDSLIFRLYDVENVRDECEIVLPFEVLSAESLDLLELNRVPRVVKVESNKVRVSFKNRDILTLRLRYKIA
ncbi:alpha-mannosidase [Sulfurisphaera tokodaii]|uniref:Alpha-mannosidase n=2 Tax=Sulfurisphaera tokodaii TaxID=111955 RepID=Q972Y1_SULTO|nr:alpha-mannosidase [Sulfurisphaera tokodaii]BAB66032.1 alpha-mannosidase [Sulfurisphaera tokodaii str. 7]HII73994.1 alpha-mannosidase [Sulfurisphaera tokodaii]